MNKSIENVAPLKALDHSLLSSREFLVTRQDGVSRSFDPIGILCAQRDAFIFEYLRSFLEQSDPRPLGGFPLELTPFVSNHLFPLFSQRIIGAHRVDREVELRSLGLSIEASDLDILSRSEGVRPVDAIRLTELVDLSSGNIDLKFFAHGVRYENQYEETLSHLESGQLLEFVPEHQNIADTAAIRIVSNGRPIGYVPSTLSALFRSSEFSQTQVAQVNSSEVGPNLRLLVHAAGRVNPEFVWPWQRESLRTENRK